MTTSKCEHEEEDGMCEYCEYGCQSCGDLIKDLSDNDLCDDCEFDKALMKADLLHDMMKDGD